MKNYKPLLYISLSLFAMVLVIPSLLVTTFSKEQPPITTPNNNQSSTENNNQNSPSSIPVTVFRSHTETIENIPMEDYIVGVVASEMYTDFELEALKAQALAARTYIFKRMLSGEDLKVPQGALVSDTVSHQVYKNDAELRTAWGKDYDQKMDKIKVAVKATEGKILTYNNEPIDAMYFSTSNGLTENSEEYWTTSYPYLRSVESPWDKNAPRFTEQKSFSVNNFEKALGVKTDANGVVGKVVSRTTGNRVATYDINGKTFKGREIRELLQLNSNDFEIIKNGDQILVITRGLGHGVGMSQFGANGMALSGSSFEQIISHYYQDVKIESIEPYQNKIMAKK